MKIIDLLPRDPMAYELSALQYLRIETRYQLGQTYQVLLDACAAAPSAPDATRFVRTRLPSCSVGELEWSAAICRRFTLEEVHLHGVERLTAWLQLSQLTAGRFDRRDPAKVTVDLQPLRGVPGRLPLARMSPAQVRTLAEAAFARAPPLHLKAPLPQDLLWTPAMRRRVRTEERKARRTLPGVEFRLEPYVQGGHIYFSMSFTLSALKALVGDPAAVASAVSNPLEGATMSRKKKKDEEPLSLRRALANKLHRQLTGLARRLAEGEYQQGEAYNAALETGVVETERWVSGARYFESLDNRIDGERVARFGAVARHFTWEQVEQFGMARLCSLLQYLELSGEPKIPEDPSALELVIPDDARQRNVKKRFADCNATELDYAVIDLKKRAGLPLSYDEDHAEELRTPEGWQREEERISSMPRREPEGPGAEVVDFPPRSPKA